jgi:two-component system CheB/CheR fusion protein
MPERSSQNNPDSLLCQMMQQTCEYAAMLLDLEGRIIAWYGGAEKSFGYTSAEALGMKVSKLFPPESVAKGMDRYEFDVAKTNIEAEDDRWMMRKDGSRFWAAGVLIPIKGSDGKIVAFGKLLRDRTDMRATTETLMNQVASLQSAEDRKNQFISTLSHELRNPLASIVNSVLLLRRTTDADAVRLAVDTLEREGMAMRRLIDDLMDVTRVAAGKIELKTRCQELCPIIESAVDACRPNINESVQQLHMILPSSPLEVDVDEDRLRQVFINLVQNATVATRNGGTIWVKVSVEGTDAVVKVTDDGIGISHELLPRIFDLFTQAEFASDRAGAGLGIGLSVVKNLTQLHGGTVQVRSDGVGKGSEFSVRLPLASGGTTVSGPA